MQGVAKRFASGLLALDGADLAVWRGEFLSLLGPSGCGKSTLLRIVAGLTEPSAGRCLLNLDGTGPGRRIATGRIGFVFQDPTLMPWASVARNVELPFRLAGRVGNAERDRVADLLRAVGLPGSRNPIRANCRAACGCGSRSPAPLSPGPICCCSTSRSPRSTRLRGMR